MIVKITPNDNGSPSGKLADADLHFTDGPLAGCKLLGFALWESRDGRRRNVTMPSRQYSINGERRSFALLRAVERADALDQVRDLILSAYAAYEAEQKDARETEGIDAAATATARERITAEAWQPTPAAPQAPAQAEPRRRAAEIDDLPF